MTSVMASQSMPGKRELNRSAALALIGGTIAMLLAAEILVSVELPRISRIERRTSAELADAVSFRRTPGGPHRVLLVGNSLLETGVDVPALASALGKSIEVRRVVVEHTFYLDWYYGLKRLFAEGAAPNVVILELNAGQLLANRIRGDYSARRLFQASDLFDVARDAGYSPTQTSSLWFAHYSGFFGMRVEVRKWLLWAVMPQFDKLQPHLVAPTTHSLAREHILAAAPGRLQALRSLAAAHGARFILLAPASLGDSVNQTAVLEAAHAASVEILQPLAPNEAPPSEFSDGFHLNPTGAARYTKVLAPLLARTVLDWAN